MSINQILGWSAAVATVGGVAFFRYQYEKSLERTNQAKPFDTPELNASREDIDARMRKLGIRPAAKPSDPQ